MLANETISVIIASLKQAIASEIIMTFKAVDFFEELQYVDLGEAPVFFVGERRTFDNEIAGIRETRGRGVQVLMGFPQKRWHFVRPETLLSH